MLEIVAWLLAFELFGLLAFPILFCALPWLPERGYSFAKPLGLLLVFYVLWLLASTPLVPNSLFTIVAVLLALSAVAGWLVWRQRQQLLEFLRNEWPLLVIVETLFLAIFTIWAALIAQDSAISHTEQPMDFAFLNATVASDGFPPNDPWLSGAQVSYYYFGYLIFGGVSRLVGISTSVGYNLGLASVAGLAAAGIFGLVFNLVRLASGRINAAVLSGLLGVLLLLFVSNLEGGLELLRAGGLESQGFWERVDIKGLDGPQESDTWYPDEPGWWWWRASRVIDTVEDGASRDYTITEFPFFSFLLGDLHPHVMSLPFVLAFLGLALGFLVSPLKKGLRWAKDNAALLALLALMLGGLGFINLWDLPVFGALLGGAAIVKALGHSEMGWRVRLTPVVAAASVLALALLLYLPFFFSFKSQADGVLPVDEFVSRPLHFFIVWGLFLFLVATFLVWEFTSLLRRRPQRWRLLLLAVVVALAPWLVWVLAEAVKLWSVPEALGMAGGRLTHVSALVALAAAAVYAAMRTAWSAPVMQLLAGATAGAPSSQIAVVEVGAGVSGQPTAGMIEAEETSAPGESGEAISEEERQPATAQLESDSSRLVLAFPLVLAAVAAFLLMGPELFKVVDLFGNRMNTIFKLSYQAWVLLAVVSSYATYYVIERFLRSGPIIRLLGYAWLGVLAVGMAVSFYYPASAAVTKPSAQSSEATLNGLAYVARTNPAEYAAIEWLRQHSTSEDVLVEAVGDDYSEYGRVSAATGIPTIIGWTFHEQQWRGSRKAFEGRPEDVERLYRTNSIEEAREILSRYGVTYIYVGPRERAKYGLEGMFKFGQVGEEVFAEGNVVIYRVGE